MKWDSAIIGSGLLAVALLASNGCNKRAEAGPGQMPPPLVTISPARAADVPVYVDEIGKVTARESVTITPQVAGKIIERHFEDGADLKKDQLLFTIDKRPFQAALDAAQAQLAQANAAQEFSKIELERYAAVANTRAISKTDYDTKKNAMDVAQAQVESAQAAVETAKLNLDYCNIRCPIDGRAGARLVDAGNVVKANEGALLLVQRLDPIYADFTINERDLSEVRRNMALGTLTTWVKLPGDPGQGRKGELTFLDNAVQDASGTIKLRATLPNEDRLFWPGQFVDVRLVLRVLKDAVLVPTAAPQIGQQGSYLFVVNKDLIAEQRSITLGQRQGEWVVAQSGVRAGENVVTDGQMLIVPNGKIRLKANAAPASTQPGGPVAAGGNQ